MTFYRVSVLDQEGIIADSRTSDSLAGTARLLLDLADCIGEPWTQPLLDADDELAISVKGAGDRELTTNEKHGLTALLEEFGASKLADDGQGGRWSIGGTGEAA